MPVCPLIVFLVRHAIRCRRHGQVPWHPVFAHGWQQRSDDVFPWPDALPKKGSRVFGSLAARALPCAMVHFGLRAAQTIQHGPVAINANRTGTPHGELIDRIELHKPFTAKVLIQDPLTLGWGRRKNLSHCVAVALRNGKLHLRFP